MAQIAFPPGGCVAEPPVELSPDKLKLMRHKLSLALSNLVLKQPFFACLVLQRPLVETYTLTQTAAADAKGRVYINPHFVMSSAVETVEKIMFLLAHETMHIAFLHCLKSTTAGRDQGACNVAMDKVINETLIHEKCGTFVEGGQRHPGAHLKTWEELYQEDDCDSGGGIGDDLIDCPDGEPTGDEAKRIEQEIRSEVAAAAQAAKAQGKLSANLSRLVDEIVYVKTPWYDILERFMTGFVASDYSWKRPNRRLVTQGYYLPGLDRVPRMGKVGIIGDTSGSIDQKTVDSFNAHMNRILEECVPEEVIVLSVDSDVCGVQRFLPDEYPIKWEPKGGGGTDMRKGWEWFAEHESELDCVVCLTDGLTPWPDHVAVPSIVLTTHEPAPESLCESVKFEE